MINNSNLDRKVGDNFTNVKSWLLIPSFLFLFFLFFYFFSTEGNFVTVYVDIQKDLFFYLNSKLSEFPRLQFNLTQLGDVLIFFPLITVFIVYAPRLWEALLTSAIISLIVSATLKKLFSMPRPAAVFDNDSFVIIGRTLSGRTALPSGHSIAAFFVITILLFAFMPKKNKHKIIWSFFILTLGFVIAISRVGVGAHYPLDVVIGSTIGYIVAVIGIKVNNEMNWLARIKTKKYHKLILIFLLMIWAFLIVEKIIADNLLIFYFSLSSLFVTLYLITKAYVKKN